MKYLAGFLLVVTLVLQYRLWVGEGSIQQIREYQEQIDALEKEARIKKERNEAIYAEVVDLKKGQEALEESARYELGMVKQEETFFQIIE
ncbi:MAG: septum formation initiator family protein [Gammaproteobacteria bacterium]